MKLFHRSYSPPNDDDSRLALVILHGLLGSSRNWHMAARSLSRDLQVFALDLRNHGDSPQSSEHSLAAMASDVLEWLDSEGHKSVHLLGHSMGGKVAMRLACSHPERVDRLVIVDIAAKEYPAGSRELDAMHNLSLDAVSSRSDADLALERGGIEDADTRQFLLTNLARRDTGGYEWKVGLKSLVENLPDMRRSPIGEGDRFDAPTLLLSGSRSGFVETGDVDAMRAFFPTLSHVEIPGSGHSPHFEARDRFVSEVTQFLL